MIALFDGTTISACREPALLEHGATIQAQHDKSMHDLTVKMEWMQWINVVRETVKEIVNHDLIYV